MNPDSLATSTASLIYAQRAYEQPGHFRRHVGFIGSQARIYLETLEGSIVVVNESLSRAEDALSESPSSIMDCMKEIKARAHDVAIKLKEIWTRVDKIPNLAQILEVSSADNDKVPDETLSAIQALATSISMYHFWWQYMQLYAQSMANQANSASTLVEDINVLRSKDVLQNWARMKNAFLEYVDKIDVLRSSLIEFQYVQRGDNPQVAQSRDGTMTLGQTTPVGLEGEGTRRQRHGAMGLRWGRSWDVTKRSILLCLCMGFISKRSRSVPPQH
ncbi:hypothetical protein BJ165DRAFT_343721 [Panaeolus papilionaceus]|nr:hypothetical protein BJ165DRAFT_343721 [Panaeolus papilionaceus]